MANSNEAFEGEKTGQLPPVTLAAARENHYEGVFSISGSSKRLDLAEIAGTDDIAYEYIENAAYAKGDLRYHSGVLYRAKVNIGSNDTPAGPWDSTKWQRAKLGEIMASKDDLDAALGNIETLLSAI